MEQLGVFVITHVKFINTSGGPTQRGMAVLFSSLNSSPLFSFSFFFYPGVYLDLFGKNPRGTFGKLIFGENRFCFPSIDGKISFGIVGRKASLIFSIL